jgi:hypothetical protein
MILSVNADMFYCNSIYQLSQQFLLVFSIIILITIIEKINNDLHISMRMPYNDRYPVHFDQKYNNIPFVFPDIPKIVPDDNFMEVWNEYNIPILRKLDKIDPKYPFTPEEAEAEYKRIGRTNEYTQPNWLGCYAVKSGGSDDRWTESLFDGPALLPKFFQQLHDYLPIKKICQVLFWSNQREIGTHRDLHEQYSWPSSLRIMIEDNNPRPTFFLVPVPEGTPANALSAVIPKDLSNAKFIDTSTAPTNVFLYNNKQYAHGAFKIQDHSKILCSLSIDWDFDQMENFLDRAIARNGNNL